MRTGMVASAGCCRWSLTRMASADTGEETTWRWRSLNWYSVQGCCQAIHGRTPPSADPASACTSMCAHTALRHCKHCLCFSFCMVRKLLRLTEALMHPPSGFLRCPRRAFPPSGSACEDTNCRTRNQHGHTIMQALLDRRGCTAGTSCLSRSASLVHASQGCCYTIGISILDCLTSGSNICCLETVSQRSASDSMQHSGY